MDDPKHDLLGYARFAEDLAESISTMLPPEGLVIGIHGAWGSGKSTLANFVKYFLENKPEAERPIIVRFYPWWFSGHEDLTRRLLHEIGGALGGGKVLKDVAGRLATLAEALSAVPTSYSWIPRILANLLRKQPDVPGLKSQISSALSRQAKRILVIVDDIDRLAADEIEDLFRAIKSVADFPNVIYLVAFDRQAVAAALTDGQHKMDGNEYLEKIVQLSFEVPLSDRASLDKVLFDHLLALFADTPGEMLNTTRWSNVYRDGVVHFVRSPRDIVRLANALRATYPLVKGEVNPIDFIAIQLLRVFCPGVYHTIRGRSDAFAGHADKSGYFGTSITDLKPFHESWIKEVADSDRENVKSLVRCLFPKLEAIWGSSHYDVNWLGQWRKELRVCSPDIFQVYFRLGVSAGGISVAEMKAILALTSDRDAFGRELLNLANQDLPDGTTKVRAVLDRLEDYTREEIPLDAIPNVVEALFDVGDGLYRPQDDRGFFDYGNDVRVGRTVWRLLRRVDKTKRGEILRDAISNGTAVGTIVDKVFTLAREHGKHGRAEPEPEEERLISAEQLKELEALALAKIAQAAEHGTLLKVPNAAWVLLRWSDWAGPEQPSRWAEQTIQTDAGLLDLLVTSMQKSFRSSSAGTTSYYRLNPRWLQLFIEPDTVIDRLRVLVRKDSLTDDQRTAARAYIREYDMIQRGIDPDSPGATHEAED